jgi:hypothetical protein
MPLTSSFKHPTCNAVRDPWPQSDRAHHLSRFVLPGYCFVYYIIALEGARNRSWGSLYRPGVVGNGPVELSSLPVLDKAQMMEHYDELVTDSRLRRDELLAWVEEPQVTVERREELARSAGGKLQMVVANPARKITQLKVVPGSVADCRIA